MTATTIFNMSSSERSAEDKAYRDGPNATGVAFITGGARGLGNAIARSFAKEGARAVVIVDILEDALHEGKRNVEALGTKVWTSHEVAKPLLRKYSVWHSKPMLPMRRPSKRLSKTPWQSSGESIMLREYETSN